MARLERWTLEESDKLVDGLFKWMMKDEPIYDKGKMIGKAKTNVFWKEYLYEQGIFGPTIYHIRNKFPSIDEKLKNLEDIQESRLASLSFKGLGKENIAKFLLSSKYGYREKTEQTTTHISQNFNIRDLIEFETKDDE
jgi:hypothetical protein